MTDDYGELVLFVANCLATASKGAVERSVRECKTDVRCTPSTPFRSGSTDSSTPTSTLGRMRQRSVPDWGSAPSQIRRSRRSSPPSGGNSPPPGVTFDQILGVLKEAAASIVPVTVNMKGGVLDYRGNRE